MNYTATITSKNQLTLPAALVKKANLKPGQKLSITLQDNRLTLESYESILARLKGSVTVPKRFKGKSLDEIIEISKKEYFSHHGLR
jgi:AbrB family looped-hinge helix DNA binding protein